MRIWQEVGLAIAVLGLSVPAGAATLFVNQRGTEKSIREKNESVKKKAV